MSRGPASLATNDERTLVNLRLVSWIHELPLENYDGRLTVTEKKLQELKYM